MKTLLILRHAKSSWKHPLADHDRPLNNRGKRDAPLMGDILVREGLVPDLIISSTANRAVKTSELVSDACGYGENIQKQRILYAADYDAYISVLRDVIGDPEVVMVVGHNPGLEELVEYLTGEFQRMPTAALAQVSLTIDHWYELNDESGAVLVNLWRPKELNQS